MNEICVAIMFPLVVVAAVIGFQAAAVLMSTTLCADHGRKHKGRQHGGDGGGDGGGGGCGGGCGGGD